MDEPLAALASQGRSQLTPTLPSQGIVDPLHGMARLISHCLKPWLPRTGMAQWAWVLLEMPHPIPQHWRRGENAKSPHFFEVALGRRGQGGKQFAAKSLHLICATFRQPHQLWMPEKQARCALRPARAPEPALTPNRAPCHHSNPC